MILGVPILKHFSVAVHQIHGYLTLGPKKYKRLLKEIKYKIVTIYTM